MPVVETRPRTNRAIRTDRDKRFAGNSIPITLVASDPNPSIAEGVRLGRCPTARAADTGRLIAA
jgi:hypothetical protein